MVRLSSSERKRNSVKQFSNCSAFCVSVSSMTKLESLTVESRLLYRNCERESRFNEQIRKSFHVNKMKIISTGQNDVEFQSWFFFSLVWFLILFDHFHLNKSKQEINYQHGIIYKNVRAIHN